MRYLTGEELRKTLGWWFLFSVFAAVVGVTYLRTLDTSPPGSVTITNNATYDYVIVGGGAAGCVLASRLSDDPRVSVLLLEAGGEENANVWNHVPLWSPIRPGKEGDYGYMTVPQKHACKAAKNKKCFWPQTKMLGGSSLTNQMLYQRGSRHDFSTWANDSAGTWKYRNVLPYFLKSEDMTIEGMKLSDYHSTNGPVPVSGTPPEISDLHDMFKTSAKELKYKFVDCNGADNIGFCHLHTTTRDGQRFSSARNYLRPAMSRKNLDVSTHSIAVKVLVSRKKAVGVVYLRNGKKYTVGANREIILTAGNVGTSQLLMLSGIGPKAHLEKLGIPVIADLSVGSNLQDHVVFKMRVQVNESVEITKGKAFSTLSYLQYFLLGQGVLSSSAGIFGNALLKTDVTSPYKNADIQMTFSALSNELFDDNDATVYGAQPGAIAANPNSTVVWSGFNIFIELLRPESRGTVRLLTNNPFNEPLIDPNYLASQKDVQSIVKGIKIASSLITTTPFRNMRARIPDKPYSPCVQHKIKSDAYWECVVRHLAVSNGQPSSSCSIGSAKDPKAVVDPNLKIRGLENIRIADASIIPASVSGDLFATKIMVAEKAGDLIRGHESVRWYRKLSDKVTRGL